MKLSLALLMTALMLAFLPSAKLLGWTDLSWWLVLAPFGIVALMVLVFCLVLSWIVGRLSKR